MIEVEPNDTHAQATPAELPCALNGVISKPGDIDYFRFKAKKGQTFDVHCYARRLGSALDSVMVLSHFNGGGIVGNDDAIGPDSYFRFTAPEDKEYVISVTDHLGKGGPNYFYRIEFTPVKPKVVLSIPKVALFSQERQTIAVPRGNRYAALISGARGDFGGELVIGAEGLPEGVTVHSENMAANLDVVPVLFEAAPTRPSRARWPTSLLIMRTLLKRFIRHFSQLVELVTGPPGQSVYWTHTVHQAAVAVIDEVPFKINIVEPKVPLVQNGSMNLKIVAERKKGYNEAITIVPLFNPPGVGSASSVTIPAGQNEVLFPINANGGAPVRKWKYVVLGVANVGNGPDLGVIPVGDSRNRAALCGFRHGARSRGAGQDHGIILQGTATDSFPRQRQGQPDWPACQGHGSGVANHQGHQGVGLQAEHRQDQPGRPAPQPVLPGCHHAKRRTNRAQRRRQRIAHRRAVAAQAE